MKKEEIFINYRKRIVEYRGNIGRVPGFLKTREDIENYWNEYKVIFY